MSMAAPLLEGVRILDVTKATAGPFGTQMLGDLGATVYKIEEPPGPRGRDSLSPQYQIDGMDAFFACVNRNKKSVALELANPEGLALFYRMVEQADVVIDNFRPGVTAKLKIDHATLAKIKPDIITASVSGYGQTGPLKLRAAFDVTVQAQTGMTLFTKVKDEQGRPKATDAAMADLLGGMYMATAVPAALVKRMKTGLGSHIDVGMYDSTISWFAGFAVHWLNFQEISRVSDTVLWGNFDTKDQPIVITAHRAAQFARFCETLGHPEWLTDPRFALAKDRVAHFTELKNMIDVVLKTKTKAEWIQIFEANGMSYGDTLTMEQALGHEHTKAREMVVDVVSTNGVHMKLLGNPMKVDGVDQRYTAPPRPGENTAQALKELLKIDDVEIDALHSKGVIFDEATAKRIPTPKVMK